MHLLFSGSVNYLYSSSNNNCMKRIFYSFLLITQIVGAQKLKKADKSIITNLQAEINYLASDSLEGRRTGSKAKSWPMNTSATNFLWLAYKQKAITILTCSSLK